MSDKTVGPLVYFRAENGNYTYNGAQPLDVPTVVIGNTANVKNAASLVWPAVDTTLSNFPGMENPLYNSGKATTYKWVNDKSFQIFSSGLDGRYASPMIGVDPVDLTAYPTGETYRIDGTTGATSFDDITNFSGGTLESQMP